MLRKLIYALPCLALAACADNASKYRDTQHLELPPTLAIEHTHNTEEEVDDKPVSKRKSLLTGLEELSEKDGRPMLLIKTQPDRAWDLIETALKLGNIEVLDKNRNAQLFQVNYDPDGGGFFSMFSNQYESADYTLTLKEGILGVEVGAKLTATAKNEENEVKDASAELIKQLHQIVQDKIINRNSGS